MRADKTMQVTLRNQRGVEGQFFTRSNKGNVDQKNWSPLRKQWIRSRGHDGEETKDFSEKKQ